MQDAVQHWPRPGSQSSPAVTMSFPHPVGVQFASQPSPLVTLPSSHCSCGSGIPSPRKLRGAIEVDSPSPRTALPSSHDLAGGDHVIAATGRRAVVVAAVAVDDVLPSSHVSPGSTARLPHVEPMRRISNVPPPVGDAPAATSRESGCRTSPDALPLRVCVVVNVPSIVPSMLMRFRKYPSPVATSLPSGWRTSARAFTGAGEEPAAADDHFPGRVKARIDRARVVVAQHEGVADRDRKAVAGVAHVLGRRRHGELAVRLDDHRMGTRRGELLGSKTRTSVVVVPPVPKVGSSVPSVAKRARAISVLPPPTAISLPSGCRPRPPILDDVAIRSGEIERGDAGGAECWIGHAILVEAREHEAMRAEAADDHHAVGLQHHRLPEVAGRVDASADAEGRIERAIRQVARDHEPRAAARPRGDEPTVREQCQARRTRGEAGEVRGYLAAGSEGGIEEAGYVAADECEVLRRFPRRRS